MPHIRILLGSSPFNTALPFMVQKARRENASGGLGKARWLTNDEERWRNGVCLPTHGPCGGIPTNAENNRHHSVL